MWVMLNDAFLSIVAHPSRPKLLLVRARQREDIEAVFPGANIRATPDRDYQFRALVKRRTVEAAMAAEVRRIDYTNFKNSVVDQRRHDAYLDVWTRMDRWGRKTDWRPLARRFDDYDVRSREDDAVTGDLS